MAERRVTPERSDHASLCLDAWLVATLPAAAKTGWFITDGSALVQQPFFAALDADRRICWTDDMAHAECFPSKQRADRFALDRIVFDCRVVCRTGLQS